MERAGGPGGARPAPGRRRGAENAVKRANGDSPLVTAGVETLYLLRRMVRK